MFARDRLLLSLDMKVSSLFIHRILDFTHRKATSLIKRYQKWSQWAIHNLFVERFAEVYGMATIYGLVNTEGPISSAIKQTRAFKHVGGSQKSFSYNNAPLINMTCAAIASSSAMPFVRKIRRQIEMSCFSSSIPIIYKSADTWSMAPITHLFRIAIDAPTDRIWYFDVRSPTNATNSTQLSSNKFWFMRMILSKCSRWHNTTRSLRS